MIRQAVLKWVLKVMASRKPDFTVGDPGNEYLLRWHVLPRNRFGNVYLHKFLRSDDDRALHDHPYANMSWVLQGGYIEHRQEQYMPEFGMSFTPKHRLKPGAFLFRRAKTPHRIQLYGDPGPHVTVLYRKDEIAEPPTPAITMFICGPRIREWGFHCPQGWVHWLKFVSKTPGGNAVGKGCDQ